jgi:hypothetical protein
MIHEYGHVFLKQDGKEKCYIVYHQKEGVYYCRLLEEKKVLKFKTLERFAKKAFGRNELEKVLVQQGVRFIRYENKALKFCVTTAHHASGNWEVESVEAAYAYDKEKPAISFEDVCSSKEESKTLQEKLEKAAIDAAQAIKGNLGGLITKIDMELAADTEGNIWLLKAASNPDIPILSHPGLHHSDYLTRRLAQAFSVHMAGETESAFQPFSF